MIILSLILFIAGCETGSLEGLSIDDVKSRLGEPDHENTATVPTVPVHVMGPKVSVLAPGDAYDYLNYRDVDGEQLHIYCVSPAIYQRIMGRSPGTKKSYVIEVQKFPAGAVF
jgi:hypothetical protein